MANIGNPTNANFPRDSDGRVYHVGLKSGEVANNILLVGEPNRAKIISQFLDNGPEFENISNRGFVTY